jgi:hypothetical protein
MYIVLQQWLSPFGSHRLRPKLHLNINSNNNFDPSACSHGSTARFVRERALIGMLRIAKLRTDPVLPRLFHLGWN